MDTSLALAHTITHYNLYFVSVGYSAELKAAKSVNQPKELIGQA